MFKMDYADSIVRESSRQMLKRTAEYLTTENGRAKLTKDVKRQLHANSSRAALACRFGVISVTPDTPSCYDILRELYELVGDKYRPDDPDYKDLISDKGSFYVMACW